MIQLFFKTTLRHFTKNKIHSLINILGLSLGLAISLLIWMFVLYELSYDTFFDEHDKIYRVQNRVSANNQDVSVLPTAMFNMMEYAGEELPEVETFTRFNRFFRSPSLAFEDKTIYLNDIILSDSTFFSVFSFTFLAGSPNTALSETHNMVLTESSALLLFERAEDAYNQLITFNETTYRVSGIIEDLPDNTHLYFSGIIPHYGLAEQAKRAGYNWFTYVKLREDADLNAFTDKMDDILVNRIIPSSPIYEGMSFVQESFLVSLSQIYLDSTHAWEMKESGSKRNIYIFAFVSVFIIIMAVINFVNLSTAKSSLRSKEIGVRKVAGASRNSLMGLFMGESFILTFVSFIIALGMAEVLGIYLSAALGISFTASMLFSKEGIWVSLSILFASGLLAGLYPAFYMSSTDAVKSLKGQLVKGKGGKAFRRTLVVFQFTLTMILIVFLWVVSQQLRFLQTRDVGFDQEQVLVVRNVSHTISNTFQAVCGELDLQSRVKQTGGANFLFGGSNRIDQLREEGVAMVDGISADIVMIDHGFIELMDMPLLEGRNFYEGSEQDTNSAFILNQAAVIALGFQNPLDKRMDLFGVNGPLIGVVQDFHLRSLHNSIEPLAFLYYPYGFPHIYIRLHPGNHEEAKQQIRAVLASFDPAYIPDFVFLDETIERFYQKEQQASALLSVGTILAVVIAVLGVYGLAAFTAERRTKEIGVRKVLGASFDHLLWVFNKESVFLTLFAFVLAAPTSYLLARNWLQGFLLQVELKAVWFVIPPIFIMLICAIIISLQVYWVTVSRPIESLRSE